MLASLYFREQYVYDVQLFGIICKVAVVAFCFEGKSEVDQGQLPTRFNFRINMLVFSHSRYGSSMMLHHAGTSPLRLLTAYPTRVSSLAG